MLSGGSLKTTKPSYVSGDDRNRDSTNSASYSGYGIAKANKYPPTSEVSQICYLFG
jgi:hypothetical protein